MFLKSGDVVFENGAPFNEVEVLQLNYDYLLATLDLVHVDIKYSDEASELVQEDCCPQEPFIQYRVESSTASGDDGSVKA